MLTIENLFAGYGKVQVLHGISIQVPRGQVVALIGSNGAGKTTTMRAVSGMIPPSGGTITLNGKRIDGMESYDIAKRGLAHSPEGSQQRRLFGSLDRGHIRALLGSGLIARTARWRRGRWRTGKLSGIDRSGWRRDASL